VIHPIFGGHRPLSFVPGGRRYEGIRNVAKRAGSGINKSAGGMTSDPMAQPPMTSLGMLDDLNELRTFQLILAQGSLSGAARALNLGLAVVSKRLSALERRVGQRLIHRTTRQLGPTDEGLALLAYVDRALAELDAAELRLSSGKDEPTGVLRVGSPVTLGGAHVAPVVAELVARHAGLEIEVLLEDWPMDLLSRRIDVAIYLGRLPDNTYVARKLVDNRRILVASPDYLARKGRPRSPLDLPSHQCLRWFDGKMPWKLDGPNGEHIDLDVPSRLRATNGDVVHRWCLDGRGIMFKSSIDLVDDLDAGRLEQVLPEWGEAATVCALLPTRRHLTPKIRVFLEALTLRFEQVLGR
jgi:LysR family transcriptional regulator, transcriptional activator for dmlA